jgi:hypothetical protein
MSKIRTRDELIEALERRFEKFPFDTSSVDFEELADGIIGVEGGFPIKEEDVFKQTG